jgi:hypothetical protein
MNRRLCPALALAVMAACGSAAAQEALFASLSDAQQRAAADAPLAAIQSNPATARYTLYQARTAVVRADTAALKLELEPGLEVVINRRDSYINESGSLVWYGNIKSDRPAGTQRKPAPGTQALADDPLNSLMLINDGKQLTGNLRVHGQLYQIRPLSDDRTAFILANEARAPKDHPEEFDHLAVTDIAPVEAPPVRAVSTIRVMVHATTRAISKSGNMSSLIDLAVAETNRGYLNSGVEINLQLAGKYSIAYTESGNFSTDLARYRSTSDGIMDAIHSTRNSVSADVAVLVVDNPSSCGLASAIGASATTAFAAVHWDCATGYYSFGHEIGHLQAARHDPANDPTNTPYAYGHGYQYAAGGWRTIMAYACSTNCTRLNFWSNPAKTYNGVPMGNTTRSNNARALTNTKATIAGFR